MLKVKIQTISWNLDLIKWHNTEICALPPAIWSSFYRDVPSFWDTWKLPSPPEVFTALLAAYYSKVMMKEGSEANLGTCILEKRLATLR